MSVLHSRRGKQVGAKDAYGNYTPGDVMVNSLDDKIYISELTADGTVASVDPPFFKGQSSYILEATLNTDNPDAPRVSLAWTYPNLALLNLTEFQHTRVDQVVVQRSTTARSTPFSQTGFGPHNANVNTYGVSGSPLISSDANWTTILDYRPSPAYEVDSSPGDYNLPTSLEDTVARSTVYNYRVLLLCRTVTGLVDTGIGVRKELDWNVVTVITPYQVNPNGAGIGWDAPSPTALSILPGFGTLTLTKCTAGGGCYSSLNWVHPVTGPNPDSYSLYKTVNGTDFENVGNNVSSPFNDGAQPGVGVTFHYKVVANLHDGSTLTSNIVNIDHNGVVGAG